VIDISPYYSGDAEAKHRVAAQIDEACRTIGFLVISGHGVDPALIDRLDQLSCAFFDLPLETKLKYASPYETAYRGYTALERTALAYTIGEEGTPPDFREIFTVNRHRIDWTNPYFSSEAGRAIFLPNVYPSEIAGLREALENYYDAMTGLATTLMRLFALALGLDEHWFDDKIDKHMTNLSLSNYPDQPDELREGQLRAGPHTDYGSITILKTEDKPGGLEVQATDGSWAPVQIIPDAFIINIGDLMAQWTNDRWVSTMHRVANPARDLAGSSRRQSLIFFHQPNYDALVECIPSCIGTGAKYPPITSGEHLARKIGQMNAVD